MGKYKYTATSFTKKQDVALAHAFNYAGSESILTGLWKVDEQSSSELIALFYNYLSKGVPKGEALRQAKLSYLQNNEGRMLAPSYWAGLVIMGDVSPIILKQKTSVWMIILSGLVLLLVAGFIVIRKKMTRNKVIRE